MHIYQKACDLVDKVNSSIQKESISRWHIFAMFVGFGLYLVLLPLVHLVVVSTGVELELGNYTNIISAGVSLLTLAEAVKIRKKQLDHQSSVEDKLAEHSDKLDQIHEHLGIETQEELPPISNPNYDPEKLRELAQMEDDFDTMSTSSHKAENTTPEVIEC